MCELCVRVSVCARARACVTETIMVDFELFFPDPFWTLISVPGIDLLQDSSPQLHTWGVGRLHIFLVQATSSFCSLDSRPVMISELVLKAIHVLYELYLLFTATLFTLKLKSKVQTVNNKAVFFW